VICKQVDFTKAADDSLHRDPDHRARPLSITIIGWYLIIGSAFAVLSLVLTNALFARLKLPFFFLGVFLFGPGAYLLLMVWMAVQAGAAVGLLKLKRLGPLYNDRPAMHGAFEHGYDCRCSR
jgi:hypothetical protein